MCVQVCDQWEAFKGIINKDQFGTHQGEAAACVNVHRNGHLGMRAPMPPAAATPHFHSDLEEF